MGYRCSGGIDSAKALLHVSGWVVWSGPAFRATGCRFQRLRSGGELPRFAGQRNSDDVAPRRRLDRDRRFAGDRLSHSCYRRSGGIWWRCDRIGLLFLVSQFSFWEPACTSRFDSGGSGHSARWAWSILLRFFSVWTQRDHHSGDAKVQILTQIQCSSPLMTSPATWYAPMLELFLR
jgi:hypothetical protein